MVARIRNSVAVCLRREHLVRTLSITVVVGTWLTLVNHGDTLLAASPSGGLLAKIALNYLTPFVVSNWGLVSRQH